jgi:hypothetical protein
MPRAVADCSTGVLSELQRRVAAIPSQPRQRIANRRPTNRERVR